MRVCAIVAAIFIGTQCMAETESVGVFGGNLQFVFPNSNTRIVPFVAGGLGGSHDSFGGENPLRLSIGGGIKNLVSKNALIETALYFTRVNVSYSPINAFSIQQSIGLLTGDGNIKMGVNEYQISLLFETRSQYGESTQSGVVGFSYGYYVTDFLRLGFQYILSIQSSQ